MQAASLWNILRVVQSLHQRQVAHFDLSPSQFAWFTGESSQDGFKNALAAAALHEPSLCMSQHYRKSSLALSTADVHPLPAEVTMQTDPPL